MKKYLPQYEESFLWFLLAYLEYSRSDTPNHIPSATSILSSPITPITGSISPELKKSRIHTKRAD